MNVEAKVTEFYENFPYPGFEIESSSDLKKLNFQKFLYEIGTSYAKPNSKVLDAGSGTGELALLFASKGFKTFGTDISDKSIQIAKDSSAKLGLKVNFQTMDVLNLKFPRNFFDLTICNGVLHHTADPELGFKNLVKVTKPNGKIMIVVYNKYGSFPRRLFGRVASFFGGPTRKTQIRFLRRLTAGKFASKSNSVVADTYLNPFELTFSISDVLSWFKKYKVEYKESAPPIEIEFYPKVITEIIKKGQLLEAWLEAREKVRKAKFSYNQPSFLLVQLAWLLSLRGNIFLIIGRKSRD